LQAAFLSRWREDLGYVASYAYCIVTIAGRGKRRMPNLNAGEHLKVIERLNLTDHSGV